jgi:hypothetical protein
MNEAVRIAQQIRAAIEGPAWHGPALLEILGDVTAQEACARPLAFAHSIWEIMLHINAWDRAVATRLNGTLVELEGDDDWPPVSQASAAAWQRCLTDLRNDNVTLRRTIAGLSDEALTKTTVGRDFDCYTMAHGVTQHILYHAGQIALIKKALRSTISA